MTSADIYGITDKKIVQYDRESHGFSAAAEVCVLFLLTISIKAHKHVIE